MTQLSCLFILAVFSTYKILQLKEKMLIPDDWRVLVDHDVILCTRVLLLARDLRFDDQVDSPVEARQKESKDSQTISEQILAIFASPSLKKISSS